MVSMSLAPIWLEIMLLMGSSGGIPLSVPPLSDDPAMLRLAPENALVYFSTNGLAPKEQYGNSSFEQLLREEEVQTFIAGLDAKLNTLLRSTLASSREVAELSDAIPLLIRVVLTRPMTFYLAEPKYGPQGISVEASLVIRTGEQSKEVREALLKIEKLLTKEGLHGAAIVQTTIAGMKYRRLPDMPGVPPMGWGMSGEYLVIAVGDKTMKEVPARLSGQGSVASWLKKLHAQVAVERRSSVSYVNIQEGLKLLELAPAEVRQSIQAGIQSLGLDNVTYLGGVMGLDGTDCVSKSIIGLDGPPKGILASLEGRPLTKEDLQTIPADSSFAFINRLDLAKVYDAALNSIGAIMPPARQRFEEEISQLEREIGFSIRQDLLEGLGDTWTIYNSPQEGGTLLTGMAATVSVRNYDKASLAMRKAMQLMSREFMSSRGAQVQLHDFEFKGQQIFYLQFHLGMPLALSWCLTEERLIVGLNPQIIKAYLARDPSTATLDSVPAIAARLKGSNPPQMIGYADTQAIADLAHPVLESLVILLAGLAESSGIQVDLALVPSYPAIRRHLTPSVFTTTISDEGIVSEYRTPIPMPGAMIPVAIGLTLPAVHLARSRTDQVVAANNLKVVGLAALSYHDAYRHLPADSYSADGKPLLSWRVHVLPYMEHENLYRQFHLDEPWDSEHNMALMAQMPTYYAYAQGDPIPQGYTRVLATSGEHGLLKPNKKVAFANIPDGLSNTVLAMFVDQEAAVPWTKPADLEVGENLPREGLSSALTAEGILMVFADVHVQKIFNTTEDVLQRIFDPADGRAIPELAQ